MLRLIGCVGLRATFDLRHPYSSANRRLRTTIATPRPAGTCGACSTIWVSSNRNPPRDRASSARRPFGRSCDSRAGFEFGRHTGDFATDLSSHGDICCKTPPYRAILLHKVYVCVTGVTTLRDTICVMVLVFSTGAITVCGRMIVVVSGVSCIVSPGGCALR